MSNPRVSKTNGSSGGAAGGRKPKRHLPASEKYELWVSVLTGQATQREAADKYRVDRSTVVTCLLYTSDAADERSSVDLGGRRII